MFIVTILSHIIFVSCLQCGETLKCCDNAICLSAYNHLEPTDFECAEADFAGNTLTFTEAGQSTYDAWLKRIKGS